MNVQKSIYNKLKADSTLVSLLRPYKTNPAIFLATPVPTDAVMPFIIIDGAVSDTPMDSTSEEIRNMLVDVRIYTDATGLPDTVETILERVRQLLHGQKLTLSGWTNNATIAENTAVAPSEADVYGRILTIRTYFQRN